MRSVSKQALRLCTVVGALVTSSAGFAQDGSSAVPGVIKQMTGCFSVTFNFIEDGDHDKFYQPVLERAVVISENPLTIARHLIMGGEEQPHWTEEWTPVDQEGRVWRQKVVGPFGDFRYECEGAWVRNQWSCVADNAAKPRRDQSRSYDHLRRTNTLQINGKRWVHAQNNVKLSKQGEVEGVEVGWNVYEKTDEARCQVQGTTSGR